MEGVKTYLWKPLKHRKEVIPLALPHIKKWKSEKTCKETIEYKVSYCKRYGKMLLHTKNHLASKVFLSEEFTKGENKLLETVESPQKKSTAIG